MRLIDAGSVKINPFKEEEGRHMLLDDLELWGQTEGSALEYIFAYISWAGHNAGVMEKVKIGANNMLRDKVMAGM